MILEGSLYEEFCVGYPEESACHREARMCDKMLEEQYKLHQLKVDPTYIDGWCNKCCSIKTEENHIL